MRTNLAVPYREKDQARRCGARWDPARKLWYVENLGDLRPFLKWMPPHLTRPHQQQVVKRASTHDSGWITTSSTGAA